MMSNQKENTPKMPTHTVYFIKRKGENELPEWRNVGDAWEHADGKGLNVIVIDDNMARVAITIRKNKAS